MGQSWCYPQSFSQESEDCVGSVEEHGDQSFSAGTGELHQQPACIQKGLVSLCLSLTPATGGEHHQPSRCFGFFPIYGEALPVLSFAQQRYDCTHCQQSYSK